MSAWESKFEQYKTLWSRKSREQIEEELTSLRGYLKKHRDGFSQITAPDELSDGDRIMALRDCLSNIN